MFSFFHHTAKDSTGKSAEKQEQLSTVADTALIAVISAAIARFRESEEGQYSEAGFVVRRVRRI